MRNFLFKTPSSIIIFNDFFRIFYFCKLQNPYNIHHHCTQMCGQDKYLNNQYDQLNHNVHIYNFLFLLCHINFYSIYFFVLSFLLRHLCSNVSYSFVKLLYLFFLYILNNPIPFAFSKSFFHLNQSFLKTSNFFKNNRDCLINYHQQSYHHLQVFLFLNILNLLKIMKILKNLKVFNPYLNFFD